MRDRRAFELIEGTVLPELIARRRGEHRLRLWSAACCTGEETYSLAIAVRRALPDLGNWKVSILGTDINRRFLDRAEEGTFGEWSFRETPAGFREQYFTKVAGVRWQLRPEIRAMVSFAHLNLAEDIYPSLLNNTNAADLILCRNALMYFTPAHAARVVTRLSRCLADGGWLLLGPSEIPHEPPADLRPHRFSGATFHRRDTPGAPATGAVSLPVDIAPDFPPPAFEFAASGSAEAPAEPPPVDPAPSPAPAEIPSVSPYEQARSLFDAGRYAETIGTLAANYPDDAAESRVTILRTRALANQGRLDEALATSRRVVADDKLNPVGHYLQAGILQELGDANEAAAAFKRALYLEPDFVLAHFALGTLARRQGRAAESARHFENALALVRCRDPAEILPESDGLTAGRLAEIIAGLEPARSAA
ncbi:MAG TPA: CheR family methyltransferase [Opitutus sp.]|nr:CheR family methyltransferase [Opitutus sp.]